MMKPRIKKMLIKALRGGKYKQCTAELRNVEEGTFCVLGVLCDLHAKKTGRSWRGEKYMNKTSTLPRTVQVWSGSDSWGRIGSNESLVMLNDNGTTFKQLARIIEETL